MISRAIRKFENSCGTSTAGATHGYHASLMSKQAWWCGSRQRDVYLCRRVDDLRESDICFVFSLTWSKSKTKNRILRSDKMKNPSKVDRTQWKSWLKNIQLWDRFICKLVRYIYHDFWSCLHLFNIMYIVYFRFTYRHCPYSGVRYPICYGRTLNKSWFCCWLGRNTRLSCVVTDNFRDLDKCGFVIFRRKNIVLANDLA